MNELYDWMKPFCHVRRTEPKKLVFDGISSEFCLVFDFEDDPETPESHGTCDALIEPLPHRAEDYIAARMRLVANLDKPGVMRLLSAMKLRFHQIVKPV